MFLPQSLPGIQEDHTGRMGTVAVEVEVAEEVVVGVEVVEVEEAETVGMAAETQGEDKAADQLVLQALRDHQGHQDHLVVEGGMAQTFHPLLMAP